MLLLLFVCMVIILPQVEGGAFSFWDNPSCTGTPNSVDGGIPSDGTCFNWQGATASLTCTSSNNVATFIVFWNGCNALPIATGTGVGDGSTCIPLSAGNNPASAIKVTCNSNIPPVPSSNPNSAYFITLSSIVSILLSLLMTLLLVIEE